MNGSEKTQEQNVDDMIAIREKMTKKITDLAAHNTKLIKKLKKV